MTEAPIQIRRPEVVRKIRELAQATGRPITDAVAVAIEQALRRLDDEKEEGIRRRRKAIDDIVARFQALPVVGRPLTDDDLYDEDGLPR
jgi:hypothetical protein